MLVSHCAVLLPSCLCLSPTALFYYPPVHACLPLQCFRAAFCIIVFWFSLMRATCLSHFIFFYFNVPHIRSKIQIVIMHFSRHLLRKLVQIISGLQCDASNIISCPYTTFTLASHSTKSQYLTDSCKWLWPFVVGSSGPNPKPRCEDSCLITTEW